MLKHLALVFGSCAAGVQAQNLVPNGGFEDQTAAPCGYIYYGIDINNFVADWHSPTAGSPDYFSTTSTCDPIPNTVEGIAYAHSGDHMAGLIHYAVASFMGDGDCPGEGTEYLQVQLTQPMVPGTPYRLQAWLRLSDNSHLACDRLAFAFTNVVLSEPANVCPFPVTPKVTVLSYITNVWTLVDTTFIADSTANYLTVGRFSPHALTTCVPQAGTDERSYYFIDDVSLTVQQTVGVASVSGSGPIGLLSNLVSDRLVVTNADHFGPGAVMELYSMTGQLVLREPMAGAQMVIDVGSLAAGRYVSRIIDGDALTCIPFVKE